MSDKFEQISTKPGFMKHNGGIMFRNISETEYEFKTTINENHLNAAGITHGGFICSLIDAGAGTAAHRCSGNAQCVTISLDVNLHLEKLLHIEHYLSICEQQFQHLHQLKNI